MSDRTPATRAALALLALSLSTPAFSGSLRFRGTGSGDVDRVKIALDAPARPIDVGGDFTLEWWMKATHAENPTSACTAGAIGGDAWINGNIAFDRDVYGNGEEGDWGVSLLGGHVAFGVGRGSQGETICGGRDVADGQWHHVAVTRRSSDGQLQVFVDGAVDGTATGPAGNIAYTDGRPTGWPGSDPFLVIGAEKHDAGPAYPSFSGWIDEVRLSRVVRYQAAFVRPMGPFVPDDETVALYHLDETAGDVASDASGAAGGPSHGQRRFGGSPAGPAWVPDTPLAPGNFFAVLQRTSGLSDPIGVTGAGDGTNRLFMIERDGLIRVWNGTQLLATPFLDLTAEVLGGGEQGLLGLAFHPDYENNGFFYVKYTCDGGTADCPQDGDLIVARYQVSSGNPNVANPASRAFMLWMDQPFSNHNGGHLAFGLDGLLYIGCGDGGAGGDTLEVAQDLSKRTGNRGMLGKMLRLDVNQNLATPPFYGIPAGNPFTTAGDPTDAINDEIWAFGLRNPWRYSFDRLTGDLYIGDVGQNTREEVSFLPAPLAPAQNFGWDVLEGTFCHEDVPAGSCNSLLDGGSRLPILEYGRNEGSTIIGGHVYRGRPASQLLTGRYVFSDLGSSRVWRGINSGGSWSKQLLFTTGAGATAFGEDDTGRLFFVGLFDGGLYQIAPYTFADTPPTSFGWSFVESVFEAGITSGCGGDNFCPATATTRGEMAVFLLRASQGSSYTPPPCSAATFTDVPCTHPFADWIYDLVARGITAGCTGSTYCPAQPVTRQEMAVLLLLSAESPGYTPPPCTSPTFNDVPCSSGFAAWIEELVRRGVTGGCGAGNYCPAGTVTRAQMAVFLVATFGLIPV